MAVWLKELIEAIARQFPEGSHFSYVFFIHELLAVVLVCLICGAVGSLVVGNRMAFFSDALAHTAFAGVGLGLLIGLLIQIAPNTGYYHVGIPIIMVAVGTLVGLAIGYVREQTGLSHDTVIGVFFAGAIGFGAILLSIVSQIGFYKVENFLFGDPLAMRADGLLMLLLLGLVTLALLLFMYNQLIFASFNPSLARSRNVPLRLCNYLFITLLAMIVGICVATVGALLINAMLVVPAAAACNLCRNIRQLFWTTVALSVGTGVTGIWLSHLIKLPLAGKRIQMPDSGIIVVLTVVCFFVSMVVGPWLKGRPLRSLAAAAPVK